MPILYCSDDNSQLYTADMVDVDEGAPAPEGFTAYVIPEVVTFKTKHLLIQDGSLIEALLESKQAKEVKR